MDDRGNILDFTELKSKYNLSCTSKEHNDVVKAVPPALVATIKGYLFHEETEPQFYPLAIQDGLFSADKCSKNKFLRFILSKECFPSPLKRYMLERYLTVASTSERIRCNYIKFCIPPKATEVHFKTMNEIYPCREFMHLKFNTEMDFG